MEIKDMKPLGNEEMLELNGGAVINPITIRLAAGIVHAWTKTPQGQATIAKTAAWASGGFAAGREIYDWTR